MKDIQNMFYKSTADILNLFSIDSDYTLKKKKKIFFMFLKQITNWSFYALSAGLQHTKCQEMFAYVKKLFPGFSEIARS